LEEPAFAKPVRLPSAVVPHPLQFGPRRLAGKKKLSSPQPALESIFVGCALDFHYGLGQALRKNH
jgi:hypothetical protein